MYMYIYILYIYIYIFNDKIKKLPGCYFIVIMVLWKLMYLGSTLCNLQCWYQ